MADYITSCSTVSDLTTWYTSTVPASVPSGDRYIAELAAGNYDLSGVTWTGKTLASAGQMIVRPQTAAKLNIAGNPARVSTTTGVRLRPTFNAVNSFGSSVADGFQFHDLQISLHQQGTFTFTSGSALHRSACRIASTGGVINFNGASGRAINCLFESTVNAVAATFNGSAAQDSNTFIAWTDRSAVSLNGNFQYATWKNCAALNLAAGATADPWPTPPTSFFSGASNNATSFATTGNCPGTSALTGVTAAALVDGAGSSTLDATPATGSVLKAAGVVSSINGGIDWYSTTRSGSTPTIGAVETSAGDGTPPTMLGSITIGTVTSSSIQVSWPAGSDNVAVTSYEVSNNAGSSYTDVGNVLTYTLTGLAAATSYDLRVRAKDAANLVSSPLSATQSTSGGSGIGFDLNSASYAFKRENDGSLIASTAVTFWAHNASTGALVATVTGLSTNASGIVTTKVTDAALSAATQYRVNYEFASGEYGTAKLTAS